jgi:peroxiredoxin
MLFNQKHQRHGAASPVRIFFLTLLMLPTLCWGQHYEISGQSSLTGVFTLTVYDGDSSTHTYTDKANKGMFFFSGNVEKPVLASIQHPTMTQPLFFYLEGSEISINVNATRPDASVIKGSRTNSEYRYLMERYYGAADPGGFLRQQLKENAGSIFIPFVLYRQMGNLDDGTLRQLIGQIGEGGRHTYHYTLLRRWLRETPSVSEGSEMPDFAYLDSQKNRHTFADSRNKEGYTLLQFSATWCDRCQQQREQAEKALVGQEVKTLIINIDDNPNGWDAHYLQQLSVNHIPYMILVDEQGIVVARDMQAWELYKLKTKR